MSRRNVSQTICNVLQDATRCDIAVNHLIAVYVQSFVAVPVRWRVIDPVAEVVHNNVKPAP